MQIRIKLCAILTVLMKNKFRLCLMKPFMVMRSLTLGIFRVRPRYHPLATKTQFRWYPTFDQMFTHLPTKLGLPSVRWPPIRKSGGYLERRKMESVYIFLYKGSNVPICKVGVFCYTTAILARCPYLPAVTCMSVRQKQTQVCRVKIHHHKGYSFDYSCSTTMTRTMILVWKNQKHFTCNIWAPKQVCNLSSTWSVLKNASTL